MTEEFAAEFARKREEVENVIASYLPPEEGFQKTVIEAANYSVMNGGKRLRPLILRETYRLFDGKGRVFEYSGTYTLEEWDEETGTWGAAIVSNGTSCLVLPSDRFRIMWIYGDEPTRGLAGIGWGTGDYAQDDLAVHYDGIRNMGADEPHDTNSIYWCNAAGADYEMRRMRFFSLTEGEDLEMVMICEDMDRQARK